jgi:hypothetical protein
MTLTTYPFICTVLYVTGRLDYAVFYHSVSQSAFLKRPFRIFCESITMKAPCAGIENALGTNILSQKFNFQKEHYTEKVYSLLI